MIFSEGDPRGQGSAVLYSEAEDLGKRLDAALAEAFPAFSRSYLRSLIDDLRVNVNGKNEKASFRLTPGCRIEIDFPELIPLKALPEKMDLEIPYEDDDLLIVNKPKGLPVHPGAGHPDHTLVNGLLWHCEGRLSGINGVLRPGIVHRIDMDTSGLLIVCKNDESHRKIAEQLAVHSVTRVYEGVTVGTPKPESGTVRTMIGRHPTDRKKMSASPKNGKPAVTHYSLIASYPGYAHMQFRLETGRTHQIRVHMAYLHHPLLGDAVYGSEKNPFGISGQLLHAGTIGFIHPGSGEYMEFHAPRPEEFESVLRRLSGSGTS